MEASAQLPSSSVANGGISFFVACTIHAIGDEGYFPFTTIVKRQVQLISIFLPHGIRLVRVKLAGSQRSF